MKNSIYLFLFVSALFLCNKAVMAQAQTQQITYGYDANGNRNLRTTTLNKKAHDRFDSTGIKPITDSIQIPTNTPTQAGSASAKIALSAYPNPINNNLTIEVNWESQINAEGLQIRLTDNYGKEIKKFDLPWGNKKIFIDLSTYKPGFYYLHVQTSIEKKSYRLIKL